MREVKMLLEMKPEVGVKEERQRAQGKQDPLAVVCCLSTEEPLAAVCCLGASAFYWQSRAHTSEHELIKWELKMKYIASPKCCCYLAVSHAVLRRFTAALVWNTLPLYHTIPINAAWNTLVQIWDYDMLCEVLLKYETFPYMKKMV